MMVDAKYASSIYGRGGANLNKNDALGAQNDMATAKTLDPNVAQQLARYGFK